MKTIITAILLVLATSQVNADGFYQAIVGNFPQSSQQVNSDSTEFIYTPLYNQITSSAKNLASQEIIGSLGEFTYTPLYLKVIGSEKPRSVAIRITQN